MRFLPPDEPVELYETVFGEDLLGREKVSKELSGVLDRIEDPLVVALDGRWGTGKSYFLKRWVGAHRKQNEGRANTVYFDAFANDYLADPLVALVAALADRLPAAEENKLDRVKRVAFKFLKPAARISLAMATAGASEALNSIGDAAAEAIKSEASNAADLFWAREEGRHAAMEEFRSAIRALTETSGQDEPTPLVIVIDELDRCRPDYALEVLEVAKHFFAVPHVHFVLGVNLMALENSVKARYGAEIDACAYLQKFLSFTLNLPDEVEGHRRTTVVAKYAEHLGQAMDIPRHLLEELISQLEVFERSNSISIRDAGKILSATALLPAKAQDGGVLPGYRMVIITLIITKVIRPDLFPRFIKGSIDDEVLVKYMGATKNCITPQLANGEQNRDYIHDVYALYFTWSYIFLDGELRDKGIARQIAATLNGFSRPHGVKKIPHKLNKDWLSVFKLS